MTTESDSDVGVLTIRVERGALDMFRYACKREDKAPAARVVRGMINGFLDEYGSVLPTPPENQKRQKERLEGEHTVFVVRLKRDIKERFRHACSAFGTTESIAIRDWMAAYVVRAAEAVAQGRGAQ